MRRRQARSRSPSPVSRQIPCPSISRTTARSTRSVWASMQRAERVRDHPAGPGARHPGPQQRPVGGHHPVAGGDLGPRLGGRREAGGRYLQERPPLHPAFIPSRSPGRAADVVAFDGFLPLVFSSPGAVGDAFGDGRAGRAHALHLAGLAVGARGAADRVAGARRRRRLDRDAFGDGGTGLPHADDVPHLADRVGGTEESRHRRWARAWRWGRIRPPAGTAPSRRPRPAPCRRCRPGTGSRHRRWAPWGAGRGG